METRDQYKNVLNTFLEEETGLDKEKFWENQVEIDNDARKELFIWLLYQIHDLEKLPYLVTAFQYIDRYLFIKKVDPEKINLFGLSALGLAFMSYGEPFFLDRQITTICNCEPVEVCEMTKDIANTLSFRLIDPNMHRFLMCVVSAYSDHIPATRRLLNFLHINSMASTVFACTPPSLQLAGIFNYLGTYNDELQQLLQKSQEEANVLSNIISDYIENGICLPSIDVIKKSMEKFPRFEKKQGLARLYRQFLPEPPIKQLTGLEFNQRFHVGEKLGEGTFGAVFSSTDTANTASNNYIAIKRMSFTDDDMVQTLPEVLACKYLSNLEGIVQIKEYLFAGCKFIEIMKCYDGSWVDYRDHIIKSSNIKKMLRGAFVGLMNITKKGFVHGDIKPGNILINRDCESCVTDFSLLGRQTENFCLYIESLRPPELFEEEKPNFSSDVWALGASIVSLFVPKYHDEWDINCHVAVYDNKMAKDEAVLSVTTKFIDKVTHPDLKDFLRHMVCKKEERWTIERCLKNGYWE